MGALSFKKMALVTASLVLMVVSYFVDGEIQDEGTREIVKEELEKMNKLYSKEKE